MGSTGMEAVGAGEDIDDCAAYFEETLLDASAKPPFRGGLTALCRRWLERAAFCASTI